MSERYISLYCNDISCGITSAIFPLFSLYQHCRCRSARTCCRVHQHQHCLCRHSYSSNNNLFVVLRDNWWHFPLHFLQYSCVRQKHASVTVLVYGSKQYPQVVAVFTIFYQLSWKQHPLRCKTYVYRWRDTLTYAADMFVSCHIKKICSATAVFESKIKI